MREQFNAKKAQWENEKNAIGQVQQLREKIEDAERGRLKQAEQSYDLEKAAELKYGQPARGSRRQLEAEEQAAQSAKETQPAAGQGHRGGDRPDRGAVDRHPCGQADARASGRSSCTWTKSCTSRVIGQDEAVQAGDGGHPAEPGRHSGPQPAHRLLPVPGPHGRGQDGAGQDAWPRPCSTTRRTWSASICRSIWRKLLRVPADRRASRIRGL